MIAVWGLTFKAGTDDLRNSPAVEMVRRLAEGGADGPGLRPDRLGAEGEARSRSALVEVDGAEGLDLDRRHAFPDAYAACEGLRPPWC